MITQRPTREALPRDGLVPLFAIHRLVQRIAERFRPELIILFGSYAYGKPNEESDVDLLVVMPTESEVRQAHRIRAAFPRSFRVDIHVRTPENLRWRLKEGDWFLREIVGKGQVLHGKVPQQVQWAKAWFGSGPARRSQQNGQARPEGPMKKMTREWVDQAEKDWLVVQLLQTANLGVFDPICFHCQQAVEKYFKALLQQWEVRVPRTHDLNLLLDLLLPRDAALGKLRRGLKTLTMCAVEVRYPRVPGIRISAGQFQFALRLAERVRQEIRNRLGIRPPRRKKP